MRLVFVGADFEENLGIGYIAAAAEAAGHSTEVLRFNDEEDGDEVLARVLASRPDVVGLSIQFQHRAREFLDVARRLRRAGYGGHVTAGGLFPTLAWREIFADGFGLDSIVRHEGERTIVELLAALAAGRPLDGVAGLALPPEASDPSGKSARRTAPRRLVDELDALPLARRYRPHVRHMGVPFVPVLGSRGCWGACSFCSIMTGYRDARDDGGCLTFRLRSPEDVAAEMALLWHAAGGPAIFCFHDDNFLLPRPDDTLERLRALRRALDGYGVGRIGLVGKARPDCLTAELARELRELGVVRLYVGVENVAPGGARHLARSRQTAHVAAALDACRQAGIFVCYNLLVFEPDATLDEVRENLAFLRAHAGHPVNFGRAEPYYGTPLALDMARRRALCGSYLGWNYRIEDDRTELLSRICSTVFADRNFAAGGVHNRYLALGYSAKLLEHFYPEADGWRTLAERADEITRAIVLESGDFLDEAMALAEGFGGERSRLERETARLGLRVAAADQVRRRQLDGIFADMEAFAERTTQPRRRLRPPRAVAQLAQRVAVRASVALWAAGTAGCNEAVDPLPPGYDMRSPPDIGEGPPDMRIGDLNRLDAIDPLPPEYDMRSSPDEGPPPDMSTVEDMTPGEGPPRDMPDPSQTPLGALSPDGNRSSASPVEHWRSTSPDRVARSEDLPLCRPIAVRLETKREGEVVRARLVGAPGVVRLRWEADSGVEGEGREVAWRPQSPSEQLRVAVVAEGGVAVAAVLARDVTARL